MSYVSCQALLIQGCTRPSDEEAPACRSRGALALPGKDPVIKASGACALNTQDNPTNLAKQIKTESNDFFSDDKLRSLGRIPNPRKYVYF